MLITLLDKLYGDVRHIPQQLNLEETTPQIISETTIIPPQYRDDVENLKSYVGEDNWKAGLEITITLQELLTICPRQRKRSDSFRKLIAYLDEELKIKITIKKKEKR